MPSPIKKGWKGGPGRPKGSVNKVNRPVRDMIQAALDLNGENLCPSS